MAFHIKVNGKLIYTIEGGRVERVSMQTNEGEAGAVRIAPNQSELNLLIDVANPHDRNLIDMEAALRPRNVSAEDEVPIQIVPNERIHAPLESTEGTTRSGVQRTSSPAELPPALARVFAQNAAAAEGDDGEDDETTPEDEDGPGPQWIPAIPTFGGDEG